MYTESVEADTGFLLRLLARWEYLREHDGLPNELEIVEHLIYREVRATLRQLREDPVELGQ